MSGGHFVSGHPGELAADGDENTYLETAEQGTRVTVICRFKRSYKVKLVTTQLKADSLTGINMALYRDSSQVVAFSALDKFTPQAHPLHTALTGNQIRLEFDNVIRLAEMSIYAENQDSYTGTLRNKSIIYG